MDRRRFLASCVGASALLAGCTGGDGSSDPTETSSPTESESTTIDSQTSTETQTETETQADAVLSYERVS
jgi:hypothetical protein